MSYKKLSFFVYGTLMPNHHNYKSIFAGNVIKTENAEIKGLKLYIGKAFPYAVQNKNDYSTRGSIITVTEESYDNVLSALDNLEGFVSEGNAQNHYDRIVLEHNGQKIYTYVAALDLKEDLERDLPVMNPGDWVDSEKRDKIHAQFDAARISTNYADFWR